MPRKGQMSDQDAADEVVRNTATHYNVVLTIPQQSSRVYNTHPTLEEAIEFATTVYADTTLTNVRAAMVYAVDANERFALVGTTNRFKPSFKPNVCKIY